MSELVKATLQEIESSRRGDPVGEPLEVQFNPASLQVHLENTIEGGNSRSRQRRQHIGRSSTTLSFDLVFDTAEEREGGEPVSVRTRTALVERFLVPRPQGNKEVPPKVRFQWGNLILDGIISDLTVDFTLFSPGGIPLRAQMNVSIQEQDPEEQFLESGPGANRPPADEEGGDDGVRPGQPGSAGSGSADRSAPALAGESLPDFAARQGLDPAAWRSMAGIGLDPLRLEAGVEISFSSSLGLSTGLSVRAGVEAGVSLSAEAQLGLEPGSRASAAAGFALTSAGGVSAGLATVTSARAAAAAGQTRAAFSVDARGASGAATPAPGSASTSAATGASRPRGPAVESIRGARSGAPEVDARAATYGLGVPLKPRRRPDPSGFGGPVRTADRAAGDAAQATRGPRRSCGCRRSPCGCGGKR